MSRPIAYGENDGRSWRCDGCGSYGGVGGALDGRRCADVPTAAAVIRPGDTVLVRLHHNAPREQVLATADRLRQRLPDVEVLVLAGVDGIDVYRPEEQQP
ncbi:hypothetical protein [Streptomyces sp. NPDC016626]|uniref:hypothetical protein n=1 Tax=Streptomyces sp. NPDC016626 TaxID=3364968 RepID=UPI0036FF52F3